MMLVVIYETLLPNSLTFLILYIQTNNSEWSVLGLLSSYCPIRTRDSTAFGH